MLVVQILVLLCCAAVALWTLLALGRIVRSVRKRRILAREHGAASDAPEGTGISALCSGVYDHDQLENLLGVEYARYEVIVVLDARQFFARFDAIVTRYRMIRVNYAPCEELPVVGVRGLYRSRQRCYRRLVLIDRAQGSAYSDFDAAAGVATYDYLLPVRTGSMLLSGTIERLAAELSEHPAGALELVRSRLAEPAVLVSRETVLREAGFSRRVGHSVRRRNRRTLHVPLLYKPCRQRKADTVWCAATGAVLVAAAVLSAVKGTWLTTALLTTAVLVWSALLLVVPLLSEQARLQANCLAAVCRRLRKHSV